MLALLAPCQRERGSRCVWRRPGKLETIAQVYLDNCKGDLPAAIVQHASLECRRKAIGKVKDLPALALEDGLHHPALIVIGEVVALIS